MQVQRFLVYVKHHRNKNTHTWRYMSMYECTESVMRKNVEINRNISVLLIQSMYLQIILVLSRVNVICTYVHERRTISAITQTKKIPYFFILHTFSLSFTCFTRGSRLTSLNALTLTHKHDIPKNIHSIYHHVSSVPSKPSRHDLFLFTYYFCKNILHAYLLQKR